MCAFYNKMIRVSNQFFLCLGICTPQNKHHGTILLIEHDMKFVSGLCDEITVLNFGTVLAQGETKSALQDPEVIRAYIGG